ncbi:hypothetical protein B484DRAFT_443339 [Ochromonadaceae sp. CCMP2298]|nr:hypothetical protein B484DRAFT_443339 [Ochromonadaceae sp. CCMP2298]|mmetsp:Transcript_12721/g.27939  ORF Transcript_12721/g.27939 Transcript_12721/m.27939 type:complete len:198 (+) Transcript_12721:92-685(+)
MVFWRAETHFSREVKCVSACQKTMAEESKETDGDMSQFSPSSNFTSRSTIIGSSDSQSSVLDLSGSVDSRVATPSLDGRGRLVWKLGSKSIVWKFHKVYSKHRGTANCSICGADVAMGDLYSTTKLMCHLKVHHRDVWDKEIEAEKERELHQPLIELFTTPAPKFEDAAVEWMVNTYIQNDHEAPQGRKKWQDSATL